MTRPEFPIGTTLPVSAIRAIREAQDTYDKDPEEWERRERLRQKELDREAQEEMEREWYEEQEAEGYYGRI